jgi:hypothetical protein
MDLLFPLLAAVTSIGALTVSVVVYLSSRKNDAGTLQVENRVARSDELSALNEALGRDLDRTKDKVVELEASVESARQKAGQLEAQVNVALANVGILLAFIEQHVSLEIPRPRLREVHTNGR